MLILPLHRPLTRATFPFATALLLLANVLVFLLFQAPDDAAIDAAHRHYVEAGLARYELPAYERYLRTERRSEDLAELQRLPDAERPAHLFQATLTDTGFAARLEQGELFESRADFERWLPLRTRQDALRAEVFTLRHLLRSSEVDPWRMLASAFLHGGLGHLVGNMLFLAALGLLVEGPLGPLRYTILYLLGALGSSAVSLAWRWGEAGGGLGASGAIAALMGAFCVIWGREPVRFFYWIGPLFDYVRAPAIWLFPVWLGWELYHLVARADLAIGFDAHAGGLVSGALLGGALVATRQVRQDFIREPASDDSAAQRWAQAQAHLGRLQLAEADALLVGLQRESPQRLDVALARFRVAQNGPQRAARSERARELLSIRAVDAAGAALQAEVLAQQPDARPQGDALAAQARRWLQLGQADAVERLLEADAAGEGSVAAQQAELWFELGRARRERGEAEAERRALQVLATRYAELPQGGKARFLLDNP